MEAHADDVPEKRAMPRNGLSNELIAILAVGVMLAGMGFTTGTWIRDDVQVLRDDVRILRGDVRAVESGLNAVRERMARVEERVIRVEERVARVEERLAQVESGLGEVHERVIRIESVLQEDSIGRQG